MTPRGLLLAGLGFLAINALAAVIGDLCSEEIRARLDRLPHALLHMATRRLPPAIRNDLAQEWGAELHEILCGAQALPITRLYRGIRYALGLLFTARRIGRILSDTPRRGIVDEAVNGALEVATHTIGGAVGGFGLAFVIASGGDLPVDKYDDTSGGGAKFAIAAAFGGVGCLVGVVGVATVAAAGVGTAVRVVLWSAAGLAVAWAIYLLVLVVGECWANGRLPRHHHPRLEALAGGAGIVVGFAAGAVLALAGSILIVLLAAVGLGLEFVATLRAAGG